MPRWLWLLIGVLLLYLVPSLILQLSFGKSYGFLSYTDQWVPDGNGGWKADGFPDHRRPNEPSVNVPLFLRIVPFVLPMVLIALFLASPLSQYVEKEADYKETKYDPEDYRPGFIDKMPELEDEPKKN